MPITIGQGDTPEEANRMAEDQMGDRPIKDSDLDPETIARRGEMIKQIQKLWPPGVLIPITESEVARLAAQADREVIQEMAKELRARNAVNDSAPPRSDQFNEPLLQLFHYEHLPPHLQAISAPFCNLARQVVATLPRNPERTVCLRKLREAEDCAITAKLWKEVG